MLAPTSEHAKSNTFRDTVIRIQSATIDANIVQAPCVSLYSSLLVDEEGGNGCFRYWFLVPVEKQLPLTKLIDRMWKG